jgi:GntR family transcriptional regulator
MRQRSILRLRDTRRDPVVAARLGCASDTEFVYLERLRLADEEPLAVDSTWLLATVARPLLIADLTETGVYHQLAEAGVRITDGQERIHAVVPTATQRRLLHVGVDVALLAIERIGRADGVAVEWRETLVRGDRFSVTAQWTHRTAYQLRVAAGSPLGEV